ncbi:MAG: ribonuclease E/G, partial [Pseudomonadota bacterium]
MKGSLIALDHWNGREAAARMIDGRLDDLLIDPVNAPRIGAMFAAKVERPLKGQGGAIVSWPGGQGFLRRAKGLSPGTTLKVQVSGYAEPGKAPPVTDRLLFKSRYAIITPDAPGLNVSRAIKDEDRRDQLKGLAISEMADAPENWGLILRSAAEAAADEAVSEDIAAMIDACMAAVESTSDLGKLSPGDGPHLMAWREWGGADQIETQDGCFEDHGILDDVEKLAAPLVDLGPHSMAVEPTRALIAVDVNTGQDVSPAAPLKANLAALKDLPRQLR